MAFQVQELTDVIKIVIMLNLKEKAVSEKLVLKSKVEKFVGCGCIDDKDYEEALLELVHEGILTKDEKTVQQAEQGKKICNVWKNLLFKTDPVTEIVAGLTDGSISGLIVIITSFLAGLTPSVTTFTAVLTLSAVAMTNFSSFLLGGKTEDVADLISIKSLIDYSLSDIPDKMERDKSIRIIKSLFRVLNKQISKANFYAALLCGVTTLLAGALPIILYSALPKPFDIIISLGFVCLTVGVFLARYRSRKSNTPIKLVLFETVGLIIIATVISLLIGGGL